MRSRDMTLKTEFFISIGSRMVGAVHFVTIGVEQNQS